MTPIPKPPAEGKAAPPARALYSFAQARELLGGVSDPTFRRWIAQRLLIPVRIGPRRSFIRHEDIVRLSESGAVSAQGVDR
jgi:hypothetical protein